VPLIPVSQYPTTDPYELLSAAARGMVPVDARLIRALLATPDRTRPALVRFAAEDQEAQRLDLSIDMLYLFTHLPTPEAVPFVINELRRAPEDAPDEMVDLALALGEPLRGPALDLFDELGSEHTDIVFIALIAGARGERVESAIDALAAADECDGEFLRGIRDADYGENPPSLPPEQMYPEVAEVDFTALTEGEREEFLASPDADHRASVVGFYIGEELSDRRRQQLLALGRTDPEARVRGRAWEALREHTVEPGPVREALMARFAETDLDPVERASLACALAYEPEPVPGLVEAIEAAYAEPSTRAKALESMWRSLDRRWVAFPPKHLEDDEDVEVVRQALMGVGYFQLRNEALRAEDLFQHPDVRLEALHAYGMAAPADETRFGLQQLRKRLEDRADGFSETEAETVQFALELRLELAGRGGVKERTGAAAETANPKPAAKAGRNDPCPCGSGKKYKKCHGA